MIIHIYIYMIYIYLEYNRIEMQIYDECLY